MRKAMGLAKGRPPMRVAVCTAEDDSTLAAMEQARKLGLAVPILVGAKEKITGLMSQVGIEPGPYRIVDAPDARAAAERCVELVRRGEADILMKGMITTSVFLHPIFRHDTGLLTGDFISHVGVLQVPGMDRLIIQTDGGLNILPDVEMKKGIIKNAVLVCRMLGIERPRVALLSATEKVHPKIPSTVEAAELAAWAREGVPDADVEGPLALDLAVSPEAVQRKGVKGAVAGRADALVTSNIEMGNVLYKALRYFAHAKGAGIVVGAACPIILTSRSDPPEEKLNSVALALLHASYRGL